MNPLRSRSRLARRTTAASAALLLGLALTGCGGDDGSGDDTPTESASASEAPEPDETESDDTDDSDDTEDSAAVPTEEELQAALLTSADLPDGFEVDPDDDSDGEDDVAFEGTCLEAVGQFSEALGSDPAEDAEVDLVVESQTGQTGVMSQIEAYTDAAAVSSTFADFTEQLQSCTEVQTTNDDGLTIDLDVTYDDADAVPGADDQLAIDLTGTIASGNEEFPVAYSYVVAVAGAYVSAVGTFALGEDTTGVLDQVGDLAALQLERVGQLG